VLFGGSLGATRLPIDSYSSASTHFSPDLSYTYQVVDSVGEGEHQSASPDAFVSDLPNESDRLQPNDALFHNLASALNGLIARLSRRPLIDDTRSVHRVLGNTRGYPELSHPTDGLFRVMPIAVSQSQAKARDPDHHLPNKSSV
jgi:hypothetical protein